MPAPLAVDWCEVKTLALAIGVREAARQMGIGEDAVRQRCAREGWLNERRDNLTRTNEAIALKRERQGLSPIVTAADILSRNGADTRAKLSVAVNRASGRLAEMQPDEVIERADKLKSVVQSASTVHQWDQNKGLSVNLSLMLHAGSAPPMLDCAIDEQDRIGP